MGSNSQRPAKRQKFNNSSNNKAKYRSQAARGQGSGGVGSASGLQSGDVGLFVTCDKGKEKACLREMDDILREMMGLDQDDEAQPGGASQKLPADDEGADGPSVGGDVDSKPANGTAGGGSIEDEIQRELAEMASNDIIDSSKKRKRPDEINDQQPQQSDTKPRLGLVTLDIPCVTFIRFPPNSPQHDPVSIVSKICRDAKADPTKQRSRFVKRLTPLSRVRKVMSGGVEELYREVLPAVFGEGDENGSEEDKRGYKYAVRVTVRNNNQVSKDEIIQTVAAEVRKLGEFGDGSEQSRHKVDLKGYDKLVMVEVYRNVIGMAVVGDEFEALRRFNLAEIYADGRKESGDAKVEQPILSINQPATEAADIAEEVA